MDTREDIDVKSLVIQDRHVISVLDIQVEYLIVPYWVVAHNYQHEQIANDNLDSELHQLKIPIECKASLQFMKKHTRNVINYLRVTGQKIGFVVSAAPLDRMTTDEGYKIINLPVYLATRKNIEAYYKTK